MLKEEFMLMALLYCEDNCLAAAAPACDQMPYGNEYWLEIFGGELKTGSLFETAYVTVNNTDLRRRLLLLGFDNEIDGEQLASELESSMTPKYLPGRAA